MGKGTTPPEGVIAPGRQGPDHDMAFPFWQLAA